ncbi:MAG: hypothetical protein Fur0042_25790 [Cyanophyceae cyanobacterium]
MSGDRPMKPKVLVIDDEADILDLLYRTLHREFRVLRANNGPEALEILEQEQDVAVIISDQRMPLMSGTEFLSLTAERYPDIIRIIVTGYTDVDDLVEAINSGKVFKYVTKPWDDEDLKRSVRKAVETHNVLRSRTGELRRALRRESLLNEVMATVRASLDPASILQVLVDALGRALDVHGCVVRSVAEGALQRETYIYRRSLVEPLGDGSAAAGGAIAGGHPFGQGVGDLGDLVWMVDRVTVLDKPLAHPSLQGSDRATVAHREALAAAEVTSSAIVPLFDRSEPLAMLALHRCGEPLPWGEDEIQLVMLVADQAALAVAQARTYDRMRALAEREALVNTISTAIRSSLDPNQIFAAIVQQLGEALKADGCALSLWSADDEYVQCVGFHERTLLMDQPSGDRAALQIDPVVAADLSHGNGSAAMPRSIAPIASNPILQQLAATQQPVAVADLAAVADAQGAELPLRHRARSLLVVPLVSEGQIIGSISLRQDRARHWTVAEIDLAQAVAIQAAIAVQQSRLYQTTRQQAEKLLELDRQKTEFFQNISHEFRTPLTLTIGPLEAAVAEGQGLPPDRAELVLRNSRRLLRLVNQLLDLQRIDAGRMQPRFHPCQLADFAEQLLDGFRPYCERKGIELVADTTPCPGVYLDVERFDKVLYNLLSNAMKFTPAGGRIQMTIQPVGDRCLLQVSDTGIGIRADQIPHLFERFRQAEGSVSRSYEGTGLGLALVKELVDLHGGTIDVQSEYGHGTTFSIWLKQGSTHLPPDRVIEQPIAHEPSRATIELADLEMDLQQAGDVAEDDPDLPTPLDGGLTVPVSGTVMPQDSTVLVVDDNPDLRHYVMGILRDRGYRVIPARNGSEGVERARQYHPDAIVTDLMMPKMSGIELIRQVRQDPLLQGTPIILLTAKADEETRIEGAEQGADAYLSKPFDSRELVAEVRNLIALKANERKVLELNTYLTESVLSRFLPKPLAQKAALGQLRLDLQPEPRLVTVLFTDLVGFTQLSNTLRSRRVAELLNEYLSAMSEIVFANLGTVDKFMGDAILALFGAPEDATPNQQVQRAVTTARQMHIKLKELNGKWREQGLATGVQFRCGIHQGTAVVGMFGSPDRSDYTAIGPCVNIASRMQAAAKPGTVLISAAVADYLDEDEIIREDLLELKGVDETVLTFTVKLDD